MLEKNRSYCSTFDNTTMYDLSERVQINLIIDKLNFNKRPKAINYYKKQYSQFVHQQKQAFFPL